MENKNMEPGNIYWKEGELTKREWFAGMAMNGILASNAPVSSSLSKEEEKIPIGQVLAQRCFAFADFMIKDGEIK